MVKSGEDKLSQYTDTGSIRCTQLVYLQWKKPHVSGYGGQHLESVYSRKEELIQGQLELQDEILILERGGL